MLEVFTAEGSCQILNYARQGVRQSRANTGSCLKTGKFSPIGLRHGHNWTGLTTGSAATELHHAVAGRYAAGNATVSGQAGAWLASR
jgi:hypothetical protein